MDVTRVSLFESTRNVRGSTESLLGFSREFILRSIKATKHQLKHEKDRLNAPGKVTHQVHCVQRGLATTSEINKRRKRTSGLREVEYIAVVIAR